ncbi:MAG TPA: sugar phosphate isomerase/epimerase [Tepidisphaeraceae bacterium]|nr:sugar phosphate isomerase/epimerase [Tepidisphaeraceae bacterium]
MARRIEQGSKFHRGTDMTIAVFAKHLQAWSLERCCERVREAGFDGLDLTVRPGGYVEPGPSLGARLADAVGIVRSHGLTVPLITTGLIRADDPAAPTTIAAATELGIPEIKLHYWPWAPDQPFDAAVDDARRQLAGLAQHVRGGKTRLNLHNHSDRYVTHAAHAVRRLVDDHDPRTVGVYLDPAHLTLEGGLAGWRSAIDLLADRITMVAVKDFRWIDVDPDRSRPQERRWVPVGSGNVRWTDVLALLGHQGFHGTFSIHGEYQGRWSWRDLDVNAVFQQCIDDRRTLLRWSKQTLGVSA